MNRYDRYVTTIPGFPVYKPRFFPCVLRNFSWDDLDDWQEQLQILQARGQELRSRNEDLEQQLALMSSEAAMGSLLPGMKIPEDPGEKTAKFWGLGYKLF